MQLIKYIVAFFGIASALPNPSVLEARSMSFGKFMSTYNLIANYQGCYADFILEYPMFYADSIASLMNDDGLTAEDAEAQFASLFSC